MSDETYEVYALRYSSRPTSKSHEYFKYDSYRQPDEAIDIDYYFWLLRNGQRTVLVDCGFHDERGAAKNNRFQKTHPRELLARMGVRGADVDHVVISHLHFDHVGNLDLFPNATFSMARAEYDFWTGPVGDRDLLSTVTHPEDVQYVKRLAEDSRVHLVDGDEAEVLPGITASVIPGHTPGQLVVSTKTASAGEIVLASDAIHFYDELTFDRPFGMFVDVGEVYQSYDRLREIAARPGTTVIAGHDPLDAVRWESVDEDCFDLSAPIPTAD